MNNTIGQFGEVWKDPVKGSWWKALLIFVGYFLIRIKAEQLIMFEGIKASGDTPTVEQFNDMAKLTEWMGHASHLLLVSAIVLLAFILIMSYFFKFKFFDLPTFHKQDFWFTVKTYLAFMVISLIIGNLIMYLDPSYETAKNQAAVESLTKNMNLFVSFLYIVIITPITEELLFRGLIMKYTFPLMPFVGALVSSLLFAGVHMMADITNGLDFLLYYTLSVALTLVYWKTRKLEYSILYHMIQNGLAFVVMALQS